MGCHVSPQKHKKPFFCFQSFILISQLTTLFGEILPFTFLAWIGSITGMSESRLAISEIGVVDADASWGKESRFGIPFTVRLPLETWFTLI